MAHEEPIKHRPFGINLSCNLSCDEKGEECNLLYQTFELDLDGRDFTGHRSAGPGFEAKPMDRPHVGDTNEARKSGSQETSDVTFLDYRCAQKGQLFSSEEDKDTTGLLLRVAALT